MPGVRKCVECGRVTVPEKQSPGPGQVKYKARGMCTLCYKSSLPLTQPTDLKICLGCSELMVPAGRVERLGFRQHRSGGYCTVCLDKDRPRPSGQRARRTCQVKGCTNLDKSRGLCMPHRRRANAEIHT